MQNDDKMKTSRASQTREKTSQKKVWTPPSSLDAPPAPDGFHHRWIRAETMGFDDSKNMAGRIRSGYELVRADAYPGSQYPTITEGKYKGVIGVGGLLLAASAQGSARSPRERERAHRDSNRAVQIGPRGQNGDVSVGFEISIGVK